ncbi:MAG: HypC/HybG/HupF family hydrogenase formation chaperone [Nitrospirae bacterium]|nr:HypC/HybG/HupF family hydrogenase formation chaperone [Nitrospirota bacterium]
MCLAVPVEVIEVSGSSAIIDTGGVRRSISLMLLPESPEIGDFVLIHAGFAIQKMDKGTGSEVRNLFREIEAHALPPEDGPDA